MTSHDCPHILGNPHPGYWFSCRCGVRGRAYRTKIGASYGWAQHVREVTVVEEWRGVEKQ